MCHYLTYERRGIVRYFSGSAVQNNQSILVQSVAEARLRALNGPCFIYGIVKRVEDGSYVSQISSIPACH